VNRSKKGGQIKAKKAEVVTVSDIWSEEEGEDDL
jgi:hypothetical protein